MGIIDLECVGVRPGCDVCRRGLAAVGRGRVHRGCDRTGVGRRVGVGRVRRGARRGSAGPRAWERMGPTSRPECVRPIGALRAPPTGEPPVAASRRSARARGGDRSSGHRIVRAGSGALGLPDGDDREAKGNGGSGRTRGASGAGLRFTVEVAPLGGPGESWPGRDVPFFLSISRHPPRPREGRTESGGLSKGCLRNRPKQASRGGRVGPKAASH